MRDTESSAALRKPVDILLPKLHHCTGEVGVVYDGVVCVAFLRVPWVVARAPWKVLQKKLVLGIFFLPVTVSYYTARCIGQGLVVTGCWCFTWQQGAILTEVNELYR